MSLRSDGDCFTGDIDDDDAVVRRRTKSGFDDCETATSDDLLP